MVLKGRWLAPIGYEFNFSTLQPQDGQTYIFLSSSSTSIGVWQTGHCLNSRVKDGLAHRAFLVDDLGIAVPLSDGALVIPNAVFTLFKFGELASPDPAGLAEENCIVPKNRLFGLCKELQKVGCFADFIFIQPNVFGISFDKSGFDKDVHQLSVE